MNDEAVEAINHVSVLMERQNAKLDGVLEAVGDIQRKVADLPTRAEFDELKQDVRVIRAAVTDLSRQVNKQSTVSVT